MARPATVFQASDLDRHGRAILDAARTGEARVREADGTSFLVIPARRAQALAGVARAAANLAMIEQALAAPGDHLTAGDFGEWAWLRHLERDDLHEFVGDMRQAIISAVREEVSDPLDTIVREWQVTADALADPDRRAVLLGEHRDEDFVTAARPGDAMPEQ